MGDLLESRIEQKASEYAKSLGMLTLKLNVKGASGWPDRIYIWNGHTWYIEFKAPGMRPRPLQDHIHKQLRDHHIVVYVVDNLIDARSILNALHNLPPVCS